MYSGILTSLPPTVSTFNFLFSWYIIFGTGAAVVVISLLVVFMVRYRHKKGQGPPPVHKTEGWKIVLVTVLISLTVLTAAEYQTFAAFGNIEIPSQCSQVPSPCVTIHLVAFQWGWNFTYPDGKFAVSTQNQPLTVPAGKIVIVNITSKDVFHSFGIPMLAVKEDAIPGKVNQLWFLIPDVGTYNDAIRCYELCGVGHAFMVANLTVIDAGSWKMLYGGP